MDIFSSVLLTSAGFLGGLVIRSCYNKKYQDTRQLQLEVEEC